MDGLRSRWAIEYIEVKGNPSLFQWQAFLRALLGDSNESSDIGGSDASIEPIYLVIKRAIECVSSMCVKAFGYNQISLDRKSMD